MIETLTTASHGPNEHGNKHGKEAIVIDYLIYTDE
jgi:hypothetical protein